MYINCKVLEKDADFNFEQSFVLFQRLMLLIYYFNYKILHNQNVVKDTVWW